MQDHISLQWPTLLVKDKLAVVDLKRFAYASSIGHSFAQQFFVGETRASGSAGETKAGLWRVAIRQAASTLFVRTQE